MKLRRIKVLISESMVIYWRRDYAVGYKMFTAKDLNEVDAVDIDRLHACY